MNSETLNEVRGSEVIRLAANEQQRARILNERTRIMREGNEAESFMAHPHWTKLQKDGEALEKRLYTELLKPDNTLRKMQGIQSEIRLLKWLLSNPKSYIEKRNNELRRR